MWSRRQDSQEFLHTDGIPEEDWPPGEISGVACRMPVLLAWQIATVSAIALVNLQADPLLNSGGVD